VYLAIFHDSLRQQIKFKLDGTDLNDKIRKENVSGNLIKCVIRSLHPVAIICFYRFAKFPV